MESQNNQIIKSLLVLFAQTDCRVAALQLLIEGRLNTEQRAAFKREYDSNYETLLRVKMEGVEDTDPELAVELKKILDSQSTDESHEV